MPRFLYRAKDTTLQLIEGTIDADSELAALNHLGAQGVFPVSLVEITGAAGPATPSPSGRRVPQRTLAYVTHQLADLLGGGLPLLSALTMLAKQIEQPYLQRVIEELASAVRDGRSLSDALADQPSVFPPLYRSMVKAGEVSGGLEQALSRLAELGEQEAELRSRVLSACVYPVFVLCLAFGMSAFLLTFVIPKLALVFIESGQALPLPTRLLLIASDLFVHQWWALLGGLALLCWGWHLWHASPAGQATIDRVVLKIPAVGRLVRKIETARLARNLGMMIGQGVPILQALEVVSSNVANAVLRQAISRTSESVRDGASLASALAETGQFPVFVANMIAVGEESGTVDAALLKVANTYEREVDRVIRALTSILDPVLLICVGGVVMFIVLAMLLPVFEMGLVVQ